jgi:hypothetical protein
LCTFSVLSLKSAGPGARGAARSGERSRPELCESCLPWEAAAAGKLLPQACSIQLNGEAASEDLLIPTLGGMIFALRQENVRTRLDGCQQPKRESGKERRLLCRVLGPEYLEEARGCLFILPPIGHSDRREASALLLAVRERFAQGTSAAGARVRIWRAGSEERTGGPAAVTALDPPFPLNQAARNVQDCDIQLTMYLHCVAYHQR